MIFLPEIMPKDDTDPNTPGNQNQHFMGTSYRGLQ